MPKRLQIKLISPSGELLNVTNCAAGQVSVLRAESPSELKPYQRALSGFQGKEKFVITLDNDEYRPDKHNLVGFGDAPTYAGQRVSEYLIEQGLTEGSVESLLISFGLENCADRLCSSLSLDEERRVRLLGVTISADKALILNEPFEPISSQWRERFAELLSNYARSKNGLVVVASLSYRPDNWIDNPAIARLQVGQSLRKTIGFGSADSETTQLMNQLRDQIRSEAAAQESRPVAAAASFGAAATLAGSAEELEGGLAPETVDTPWWKQPSSMVALKGLGTVGAGAVGIWAALTFTGVLDPTDPAKAPPPAKVAVGSKQDQTLRQIADGKDGVSQKDGAATLGGSGPEITRAGLILDKYPEAIRVSLLDTGRGILGEVAMPEQIEVAPQAQQQSGNLYSLLESASSDKPEPAADWDNSYDQQESASAGNWSEPEESEALDPSEEEARREAIRQKFLEAIRAAAERRQAEGEE